MLPCGRPSSASLHCFTARCARCLQCREGGADTGRRLRFAARELRIHRWNVLRRARRAGCGRAGVGRGDGPQASDAGAPGGARAGSDRARGHRVGGGPDAADGCAWSPSSRRRGVIARILRHLGLPTEIPGPRPARPPPPLGEPVTPPLDWGDPGVFTACS
jgi:hypothetical protein